MCEILDLFNGFFAAYLTSMQAGYIMRNAGLDEAQAGIKTAGKESESEVAQSCPTLCDPMDCSLPRSSVHGIFQAIVLEWIAIKVTLDRNKTSFKGWSEVVVEIASRGHCSFMKLSQN